MYIPRSRFDSDKNPPALAGGVAFRANSGPLLWRLLCP